LRGPHPTQNQSMTQEKERQDQTGLIYGVRELGVSQTKLIAVVLSLLFCSPELTKFRTLFVVNMCTWGVGFTSSLVQCSTVQYSEIVCCRLKQFCLRVRLNYVNPVTPEMPFCGL
jgi:hypothetical protein